jgi:hypothetical protein
VAELKLAHPCQMLAVLTPNPPRLRAYLCFAKTLSIKMKWVPTAFPLSALLRNGELC